MKISLSPSYNIALFVLTIFFSSITCNVMAQNFEYQSANWEETPVKFEVPDSLNEANGIYIKYHEIDEFDSEASTNNSMLLQYRHKILYINSDKAIEDNNRVYIPLLNDGRVDDIKVRIIQPNGKVEILDKKDIKKGQDEESEIEYQYFAINGLQIGSIIETLYKIKKSPEFYGKVKYILRDYPVLDYKFAFISPQHLFLDFKFFNTDMSIVQDTIDSEKDLYVVQSSFLPKSDPERYAYTKADGPYFVYKLDKNYSRNKKDINGYGHYSKIIGERGLNVSPSKSESKKLKKIFSSLDITDEMSDQTKALKIEHFLKTNYTFIDQSADELEHFEGIFKSHAFNDFGAMMMYRQLMNMADMTLSVVMTCNKTEMIFDEDFEAYVFLDETLLYIKELDLVIDPSDALSRLMYINPFLIDTKGLFIESKTIGGKEIAIGKIKTIPANSALENLTKAKIDVNIVDDFDDVAISLELIYSGQIAKRFQPLFNLIEEDKLEEFYKYVLQSYADQTVLSEAIFENIGETDFPIKPFIAKIKVNSDEYLEKAGNSYIIHIGSLIGPQSEMYQPQLEERKAPIHSGYARAYQYQITFNIPDGYQCPNLEDLNFDVNSDFDEMNYHFKSKYTLKKNVVTVDVDEIYDQGTYPASHLESYRKVVNAAADFSKVKIIFKPN